LEWKSKVLGKPDKDFDHKALTVVGKTGFDFRALDFNDAFQCNRYNLHVEYIVLYIFNHLQFL
jgi:hypothetical protein